MVKFVQIHCTSMACFRNFGLFWYQKLREQAIGVQSIRTKLAITQKPFEIFGWNFHQLLVTYFELIAQEILIMTQLKLLPRPWEDQNFDSA